MYTYLPPKKTYGLFFPQIADKIQNFSHVCCITVRVFQYFTDVGILLICYGTGQVTFRAATCPAGKIILNEIWNHLLTYLITPRSRVLLEKLTGSQIVKIYLAFYGNRKFITALTRAFHLSLS
jgi:hypothetical protein